MRKQSILFGLALSMAALISACGGGDGGGGSSGSSGSGTVSMNVTDAKPMLPTGGVESVTVTFDEVSVHRSGGGWTTLATATRPYTIDLYQFSNGVKTQFVPPVQLESGKYTQVRIGVASGIIRISGVDHPLEIPSSNLKTDKNFEFTVVGGGAVDLTVDFDLSQSIVLTGSGKYQLKPVLHVNQTSEAATIQGTINFGATDAQATVTVIWDKNGDGILQDPDPANPNADEEYTSLLVLKTDTPPFKIFWLVPNQGYFVQVQLPNRTFQEYVPSGSLGPGAVFTLKGGSTI
jgi:hypothetical protein